MPGADDGGPGGSGGSIEYRVYVGEEDLPTIMALVDEQLSEPYSIFTYRFFVALWPNLCRLAYSGDRCVGTIVCKQDVDRRPVRGYIGMLVVVKEFRGRGIATKLVSDAIDEMRRGGCEDIVLEAEVTNKSALALYGNLGFLRAKRLHRYYLNGQDAFRLKLRLTPQLAQSAQPAGTMPGSAAPAQEHAGGAEGEALGRATALAPAQDHSDCSADVAAEPPALLMEWLQYCELTQRHQHAHGGECCGDEHAHVQGSGHGHGQHHGRGHGSPHATEHQQQLKHQGHGEDKRATGQASKGSRAQAGATESPQKGHPSSSPGSTRKKGKKLAKKR